jgi:putative transposase
MKISFAGLVRERAHHCCEYCRMPQRYDELPFEIDHILAEQHGGKTVASNLARRVPCFRGSLGKSAKLAFAPRKHGKRRNAEVLSAMHRKRVKSYNEPGHAHELTFSCFRRLPLLSRDRSRRWFVDAMDTARRKCRLLLWAYVIMPEHVHLIVWPQEEKYEMRMIRTVLKVPVQRQALKFLQRRAPKFLDRLADKQPNGEVHYRFWQRGGGYDRNIIETSTLGQMIEYIHNNPVRRGLVDKATDWVWSSARFYAGIVPVPTRMDPLPSLDG